ncbi:hypothetical protein [Sediminispirochaeta smaragdinae]|nr:hypothetical protein [Sediminispirochaeta smaragdinae]
MAILAIDYSLSTLSSTTISLKSHYEVREEDDLDSVTITRGRVRRG